MQSYRLRAVIDRPYIGESHSFTAPTTADESKYLKLSAAIEGVKKLGTDPEIAKRLLQRLNLYFDFGVRPNFFTPSMTAHDFAEFNLTGCGRS